MKADDPAVTVDGGTLTIPVKSPPRRSGSSSPMESGATSAAVAYVGAAGSGGRMCPKGRVIAVPGTAGPPRRSRTSSSRRRQVPERLEGQRRRGRHAAGRTHARQVDGAEHRAEGRRELQRAGGGRRRCPRGRQHHADDREHSVQVGPSRPILRSRPTDTFSVSALGDPLELDITRLCHVWIPEGSCELDSGSRILGGGTELRGGDGAAADEREITLTADSAGRRGPGAPGSGSMARTRSWRDSPWQSRRRKLLTVTPVTRDHVKAANR